MSKPREQEPSKTPTADAVWNFLKGLEKQQEPIRQQVRGLYHAMRDVGQLVASYHDKLGPADELGIRTLPFFNEEQGRKLVSERWRAATIEHHGQTEIMEVRVYRVGLTGLGLGDTVTFLHRLDFQPELADSLMDAEILSWPPVVQDYLIVNLHTDQQTEEQARKLIGENPRRISRFETSYFLDNEGRYLKASRIPPEIKDDRRDLLEKPKKEIEERPDLLELLGPLVDRIVLSEMNEQDFVIVRQALEKVRGTLNVHLG